MTQKKRIKIWTLQPEKVMTEGNHLGGAGQPPESGVQTARRRERKQGVLIMFCKRELK